MSTNNHTATRREFLAAGVKAATGFCILSALPPSSLSAAEVPLKSKMRFGLCTYMWGKDWDVPTLIANCQKAGVYGVEPRTSMKFAHGIELTLSAEQRAEIKKRFTDSPVRLASIACGERMDWPQPEKLQAAIDTTKGYLRLSRDLGCDVLRVFPNQFHPEVPREKTIEQIARALNELGAFAVDLGQEVSLEAHGPVGELPTLRAIMDRVTQRNVRVRLNSDIRDTRGKGFTENFNLVKDVLSRAIHLHDLKDPKFPFQLMVDLLVKAKWEGCAFMERSDQVPDRVAALAEQRQIWEAMIDKAAQGRG